MGLSRLVALDKGRFVGQDALREEAKKGPARQIVGLEIDWNTIEAIYDRLSLAPQVPAAASRTAVPVYRDGEWVGKATSTTWSPILKKMIALATVARGSTAVGHPAGDGIHRRGRAGEGRRDRRRDAVLQSPAQDRHAGPMNRN